MCKDFVHTIGNYDVEERGAAMWDGYLVEFTKEEYKRLGAVDDLHLVSQKDGTVVVQYRPKVSEWEGLFQ